MYEYSVSLCITHPEIDPNFISEKLDKVPHSSRKVGVPNPFGEGLNRESFWRCRLHEEERINYEKVEFEQFLLNECEALEVYAKFFEQIKKSGGYIEVFIGLFADSQMSFTLDSTIIKKISNMNVAVGFDIYA